MRAIRDRSRLNDPIAEAIISGHALPADAPAGSARLATVLAAAAAEATPEELAGAQEAGVRLGTLAAELGRRAVLRRRPSFRAWWRIKVVAVGLAVFLLLTGGLAAAGALPDGPQRVAHGVLKKVGIHVPGPNPRAGNHPFERGKSGKPKKVVPGQKGKGHTPPPFATPSS